MRVTWPPGSWRWRTSYAAACTSALGGRKCTLAATCARTTCTTSRAVQLSQQQKGWACCGLLPVVPEQAGPRPEGSPPSSCCVASSCPQSNCCAAPSCCAALSCSRVETPVKLLCSLKLFPSRGPSQIVVQPQVVPESRPQSNCCAASS